VITAIDGQAVKRFEDMVSYLFNKTAVGQAVKLTVLRAGNEQIIELILGARPD
jgi:S1-C subfamily serine protease